MDAKYFLPLLYASVAAILVVLAITLTFALRQEKEFLTAVPPTSPAFAQRMATAPSAYQEGKVVWNKQACGSCHNKNMKDDMTAPALGGVTERWATYPREDLYAWIRNSQRLIAEQHPRALELWEKWRPLVMSRYDLTDEEIEAVLAYIEQ